MLNLVSNQRNADKGHGDSCLLHPPPAFDKDITKCWRAVGETGILLQGWWEGALGFNHLENREAIIY